MNQDALLSEYKAAQALGITHSALWQRRRAGTAPAHTVSEVHGKCRIYYKVSDIVSHAGQSLSDVEERLEKILSKKG